MFVCIISTLYELVVAALSSFYHLVSSVVPGQPGQSLPVQLSVSICLNSPNLSGYVSAHLFRNS